MILERIKYSFFIKHYLLLLFKDLKMPKNNRQKEYKKQCELNKNYKQDLSKLLEQITYKRKYINKHLNNYYDQQMENLERYRFKIKLDRFNNQVNYSRFLKGKIKRTNTL